MSKTEELKKKWAKDASKLLVGRKITHCRYMIQKEMDAMGWYKAPLVIQLDDGNLIYPAMDDEGNDGGALYTNDDSLEVIPTI